MELRLEEEGILSTSEGTEPMKVSGSHSYPVSSIIKLHFSICDGKVCIHKHFESSDKVTTNSDVVV